MSSLDFAHTYPRMHTCTHMHTHITHITHITHTGKCTCTHATHTGTHTCTHSQANPHTHREGGGDAYGVIPYMNATYMSNVTPYVHKPSGNINTTYIHTTCSLHTTYIHPKCTLHT